LIIQIPDLLEYFFLYVIHFFKYHPIDSFRYIILAIFNILKIEYTEEQNSNVQKNDETSSAG
jgi:hypothetical protein